MCTSEFICITNRRLCSGDLLEQLERVAGYGPKAIVLREKDLSSAEYKELAQKVLKLCSACGVACILHSFVDIAIELHAEAIHVPLSVLRNMTAQEKSHFKSLGASCHSLEEALEAQSLGCTYITVGHIFATDCKKGVPGRGLAFLQRVCQNVSIPVYAIGGITPENISQAIEAGAIGGCMMSWWMRKA